MNPDWRGLYLKFCEKCDRAFDTPNETENICKCCIDPDFANLQKEKLNKSKYLKVKR